MTSQNILPEGLVERCLDVLRKLSPNERDLIRVVVEVVHELRDNSDEDDLVVSDFWYSPQASLYQHCSSRKKLVLQTMPKRAFRRRQ